MSWTPGSRVHLETERFVLDSMPRLEAALRTYRWTFDPEVMNPLGYPAGTWSRRSWYKKLKKFDNRKRFFLAIRPKGSDEVIGFEQFEISGRASATLTIAIGNRDWWGKGVGRETRPAIAEFLFERVGCHRITGMVSSRNLPSIFNHQMLGMVHEGTLRENWLDLATGEFADLLVFGLLRSEWRRRREEAGRRAGESHHGS